MDYAARPHLPTQKYSNYRQTRPGTGVTLNAHLIGAMDGPSPAPPHGGVFYCTVDSSGVGPRQVVVGKSKSAQSRLDFTLRPPILSPQLSFLPHSEALLDACRKASGEKHQSRRPRIGGPRSMRFTVFTAPYVSALATRPFTVIRPW